MYTALLVFGIISLCQAGNNHNNARRNLSSDPSNVLLIQGETNAHKLKMQAIIKLVLIVLLIPVIGFVPAVLLVAARPGAAYGF